MSTKKSRSMRYLEKLSGGELTFGQMISSHRKCDEVSQMSLAKKLKVSKAYLCDIEKGRRYPSIEVTVLIAKVLGYSPEHFVSMLLQEQAKLAGFKWKIILKAA